MASESGFYKRFFSRITLFISLLILPFVSTAHEEPDDHETVKAAADSTVGKSKAGEHKGFNAGTTITEHISNSHDWHLWGHTHIPLPVIIYTDKGIECFMSSAFLKDGEEAAYTGKNYTYEIQEGHIVIVNPTTGEVDKDATKKLWDFSITKNVLTVFIVLALMLWMFTSMARAYRRRPGQAPRGMQSLLEPLVIFVRDDIAKAAIGPKKYERYMPYLLTVFFFIWIANLLGIIPIFPGGANMTGNITITMSLALLTFIITTASANGHYWRHVFAMPGVPIGVLVILTPIEILGVFLRPFVLMIRLFANMLAGHIIALSFFCMIFIFSKDPATGADHPGLGWGVGIFSWLFVVFMTVLELLVAFLQAYVFTLLSAIYFGSATEEHHHADAHGHEVHDEAPGVI